MSTKTLKMSKKLHQNQLTSIVKTSQMLNASKTSINVEKCRQTSKITSQMSKHVGKHRKTSKNVDKLHRRFQLLIFQFCLKTIACIIYCSFFFLVLFSFSLLIQFFDRLLKHSTNFFRVRKIIIHQSKGFCSFHDRKQLRSFTSKCGTHFLDLITSNSFGNLSKKYN